MRIERNVLLHHQILLAVRFSVHMSATPNRGWGWAELLPSQFLGYRSHTWGKKTKSQLFQAHSGCVEFEDSSGSPLSLSEGHTLCPRLDLGQENTSWIERTEFSFPILFHGFAIAERKSITGHSKGQGGFIRHIPKAPTKRSTLSVKANEKTKVSSMTRNPPGWKFWGPGVTLARCCCFNRNVLMFISILNWND